MPARLVGAGSDLVRKLAFMSLVGQKKRRMARYQRGSEA